MVKLAGRSRLDQTLNKTLGQGQGGLKVGGEHANYPSATVNGPYGAQTTVPRLRPHREVQPHEQVSGEITDQLFATVTHLQVAGLYPNPIKLIARRPREPRLHRGDEPSLSQASPSGKRPAEPIARRPVTLP